MAHRKKSKSKRSGRRSKKGKRLSKFMVRAIKAVTKGEIETKRYTYNLELPTWLPTNGYIAPASGVVIRGNIYAGIPKTGNIGETSEEEVIGNIFDARGFKWVFHAWRFDTVGLQPDITYRFTVYSEAPYDASESEILATTSPIFDPNHPRAPTISWWNNQYAKIHFQKTFNMRAIGQQTNQVTRKFWIPIRGKKTSISEESLVTSNYVGQLKNKQYYWVLEILAKTGGTFDLSSIDGRISTAVYFKDA